MTVLENIRANPGLARAIFRQLAAVGGEMDRDSLLRTVAPPGAGWYEPKKAGDARDETMTVLKALKVINENKAGVVGLAVPTDQWGSGASVGSFRRVLRHRLFAEVGKQNPFDGGGLATFAGALAWLLAQDPLQPLGAWGKSAKGQDPEKVQLANLGQSSRLISNEYQWPVFARWAIFFGFAAPLRLGRPPDLVAADPTVALRDHLDALVPGDAARSLTALARALPVLDGGVLRKAVESKWRGDGPPSFVSPSLAVALVRLQMEGVLNVENVPDAQAKRRVVLNLSGDSRTVSSLEVRPADG